MPDNDDKPPVTTTAGGDFEWHMTTTGKPSKEETDEGEVTARVNIDITNDRLIMTFGRDVSWVSMNLVQAKMLAALITQRAAELEKAAPRAKVIRLPVGRKGPPK